MTASRQRWAGMVAALVAAQLAMGCEMLAPRERPIRGMNATNQTDVTLALRISRGQEWLALGPPIEPGRTGVIAVASEPIPENSLIFGPDGCTLGAVVAFNPEGREVARHPPPLCFGETWVIDDSQSAPAPSR